MIKIYLSTYNSTIVYLVENSYSRFQTQIQSTTRTRCATIARVLSSETSRSRCRYCKTKSSPKANNSLFCSRQPALTQYPLLDYQTIYCNASLCHTVLAVAAAREAGRTPNRLDRAFSNTMRLCAPPSVDVLPRMLCLSACAHVR